MPQTGSLTTVVFFITMSPLFRCFLCNQVASRRRGSWGRPGVPGLTANTNVPSRCTVCIRNGRFHTCLHGLASRSRSQYPATSGKRSVLPHIKRVGAARALETNEPRLAERIPNATDKCPDWRPRAKTTMLTNTGHLKGFVIRATDGELGTVDHYFDDETWAIRYLVVETGGWLSGRRVLISPISAVHTDLQARRVDVALTKQQVENSPDIDTRKPVSRQHEAEYLGYFGYPLYWSGPYLWGPEFYPGSLILPTPAPKASGVTDKIRGESADSHLRSTEAVTGYHIEATDGEIGHVDEFVVDDEVWAIRYIEVATRNWWPGKRVLVSPAWIERVSWTDSKVYVGLSRDAIQLTPEYVESMPISRDYENQLYFHYGRPPYWLHEAAHKSPFSISGV